MFTDTALDLGVFLALGIALARCAQTVDTLHFARMIERKMQAGRLAFVGVKNDGGDGGGGGVLFHNRACLVGY